MLCALWYGIFQYWPKKNKIFISQKFYQQKANIISPYLGAGASCDWWYISDSLWLSIWPCDKLIKRGQTKNILLYIKIGGDKTFCLLLVGCFGTDFLYISSMSPVHFAALLAWELAQPDAGAEIGVRAWIWGFSQNLRVNIVIVDTEGGNDPGNIFLLLSLLWTEFN